MSSSEIVESFLRGEISRRTLVRRLMGVGVSMSAAVAYSELLRPEWALAAEQCTPEFYELYGFYGDCDHYEHYEQPPPKENPPPENKPPENKPPENNPPPPQDTTRPVTGMKISKLSLVSLLVTGKLVVDFTMNEPGSVSFTVTLANAGGSDAGAEDAKRLVVARGSTTFGKAGKKRVRLKLTRRARRILKKRRRATLRIRARAVDRAGNARVRTSTLKLR
jgi:hypothetical protein